MGQPTAISEPLHHVEAEYGVIGGLLLAPERFAALAGRVTSAHFDLPMCSRCWQEMERQAKTNGQPDEILVGEFIKRHYGGDVAVNALADMTDTPSCVYRLESYVTLLCQYYAARRLRQFSDIIGRQLRSAGPESVPKLIHDGTKLFNEIEYGHADGKGVRAAELVSAEGWDVTKPAERISLVLPALNRKAGGGVARGSFVIIAGRPGAGKSSVALQMMMGMAENGLRCGFVSCEMGELQLRERILSIAGRIDNQGFADGLGVGDTERADAARKKLDSLPLLIYPVGGMSARRFEAFARRIVAQDRLDVLALDYIQLLRGTEDSRRNDVATVTKALKSLAEERAGVTVGLSQLRRPPPDHPYGLPALSDLKESGDLEQDADLVVFLHRPRIDEPQGEVTLIVAKNRMGPTGQFKAAWVGRYTRLEEESYVGGDKEAEAAALRRNVGGGPRQAETVWVDDGHGGMREAAAETVAREAGEEG